MTETVAIATSSTAETTSVSAKRPYFSPERGEAKWPLVYMLGLAMIGLKFPVGWLVVLAVLVRSWRQDRYDFLMQLMLLLGGYGNIDVTVTYISFTYIGFALGVVGIFLFRRQPLVRKATFLWLAYLAVLLIFAKMSDESLRNQLPQILSYASFIYLLVPLMVFSGREFKMDRLYRLVIIYSLIYCAFYAIDGFVLCGNVLMPRTWLRNAESTIFSLFWQPFSMNFLRKYPQGLFVLAMLIIPVIRAYRLKPWMWVVVIAGMASTFTFTFITGFAAMYLIFKSNSRTMVLYVLGGALALTSLYFIDTAMGGINVENGESPMRIKSSIDQIINLDQAEDEDDLGRAGSGRMAQIIPKVELLYDLNRQWIGFGFLDRNRTKLQKYIIENELYLNPDDAEEVATGVEVMPVQVFLVMGWIGLLLHILFFVALWWIIKDLKYSAFFLSAMLAYVWWGLGGFDGLITQRSMFMLGTIFAAVIMANKRVLGGFSLPELPKTATAEEEAARHD